MFKDFFFHKYLKENVFTKTFSMTMYVQKVFFFQKQKNMYKIFYICTKFQKDNIFTNFQKRV